MGKNKDISDYIKSQINAFSDEGYSQISIAKHLGISRCAVQNALKFNGNKRKNCKGVRSTNSRDDRFIKRCVTDNPSISSSRISHIMKERNVNVSSRTVRRRLQKDLGMPAKKPMLTEKQRLMRLKFCRKYKDCTAEWWERVLFTDESMFQQVRNVGTNYVRRPSGSKIQFKIYHQDSKISSMSMCIRLQ